MPNALELFMAKLDKAHAMEAAGERDRANQIAREAAESCPEGWVALGCEYLTANDLDAAAKIFTQTLTLTKDRRLLSCALNNLGMISNEAGDRHAANEYFKLAHEQDENPMVLNNIGLYQFWQGEIGCAQQYFLRALDMDPHFNDAEFHLSLLLLKIGDWKEGWRRYESRWRSTKRKLRKLEVNKPEWDGNNPVEHLLVVCEQGYGDTIMCARLASAIASRGVKRQTWVVQSGLGSLISSIGGINVIESFSDVDEYDALCQTMSLWHLLGITLSNLPSAPYIPVPPYPAAYGPGKHVGIIWKGSSAFTQNVHRSSRLEDWAPILEVDGFTFHSLQVGGEDEGLIFPQLVQHGKPADWLDTARRMAGLDLIISVDTGPAHVAGAMGKPVWIILPQSAEWRWGCDLEKTALYPSARLFRMAADGEWKQTLARAADALKDLC